MLDDGEVRTPPGFKEAYQQFVEGGWPSLDQPSRYGGQDLPMSIGMSIREMAGTANWSWSMYSGLSHGAVETIDRHGSEEQKATFMEPLVSGRWTGTMCLTEAHCGTDLGLLKTKAEPAVDGTYRITGSKLFVSSKTADADLFLVLRLFEKPWITAKTSRFLRFPIKLGMTIRSFFCK